MTFDDLDEFSLWLEPVSDELERIQDVILNFSQEAQVENFVPHVTLLANIPYNPEKIKKQLSIISKNLAPFEIKFSKISISDYYLKCLFIECEPNLELMELNKKAQEIFGMNNEYKSHMSFVYGDVSGEIKKNLAKKIKELGLEYFSFIPKKLSLWHAQGTPSNWKKLHIIEIK